MTSLATRSPHGSLRSSPATPLLTLSQSSSGQKASRPTRPRREPTAASLARVAALARRRRWRVDPYSAHVRALAAALDDMDEAGVGMGEETLATYADAAGAVARADVAGTTSLSRERAVERAVTGTLLGEPVLVALRRLAQEGLARRRGRG